MELGSQKVFIERPAPKIDPPERVRAKEPKVTYYVKKGRGYPRDEHGLHHVYRDIIERMAAGESSEEIADEIGTTPETIHTYRQKILTILKANTAAHMISICYQKGILKINETI